MQTLISKKLRLKLLIAFLSLMTALVLMLPTSGFAQTRPTSTPGFTPPPPTPISPLNNNGITLEVKAGFDGYFKVQEWVPIQVTVSFDKAGGNNIAGRIEASTTNFDRTSTLYTRAVQLTPPARKTFWLYMLGQKLGYNLEVRLVSDDGTLIAQTNSQLNLLPESAFLLGVVSENSHNLNYLNGTQLAEAAGNYSSFLYDSYTYGNAKPNSLRGNAPRVTVANLSPADLPPSGAGMNALDGLVVSDLNVSSFAGNGFDKTALTNAVASWASQGKALIVAGDSGLRYGDLFRNLLPVQDNGGPVTLADLSDLQKFSHAHTALVINNSSAGITTAKVKLVNNVPGAAVLAQNSQGLPLLVTRPFGMGQVWFVAPELQAFESWQDAPTFWNALLNDYQLHLSYANEARQATNGYYQLDDLLPIAQRNDLPDPFGLLVFLAFYILVVGPLNYFVLRRFDRRELAWVTIPILTLAFSTGAYLVGSNSGVSDLVVSRVTVLTVGQGNDGNFSGASTELASIYSNGRNNFKLQVEPDTLTNQIFQPDYNYGYNFGGRYNNNNQQVDVVQEGPGGGYPALSIGTRGSRNYAFENDNAAKLAGRGLVGQVSLNSNGLSGSVQNVSSSEWDDVSIFVGRLTVRLGNLKPGQRVQLGQPVGNSVSLVNALTGFNTSTGNGYGYYYNSSTAPKELDINKQKARVLESLLGDNGDGLKSTNNIFYLTAWNKAGKASFQPQDRTETGNNLTLLFETLTAS